METGLALVGCRIERSPPVVLFCALGFGGFLLDRSDPADLCCLVWGFDPLVSKGSFRLRHRSGFFWIHFLLAERPWDAFC